jgi:hypothetical protein
MAPCKVGTLGSYNLSDSKKRATIKKKAKALQAGNKKKKAKRGRPGSAVKRGTPRKGNYRNDFLLLHSTYYGTIYSNFCVPIWVLPFIPYILPYLS